MWRQATAAAFLRAHTSNIEAASLPSGHAPAPISRSGRSDAPFRLRSALRKKLLEKQQDFFTWQNR